MADSEAHSTDNGSAAPDSRRRRTRQGRTRAARCPTPSDDPSRRVMAPFPCSGTAPTAPMRGNIDHHRHHCRPPEREPTDGRRLHRPRRRSVALTFDDGPDPQAAPRLLEVLRKHHVRAVFCLWGDHVREHLEVVREIVRDGHEPGNHSLHHDDMSAWTPERIRADLQQTGALIHQAASGAPVRWFRAPYGSWGRSPRGRRRTGHAAARPAARRR
ncbi:polysaccharide deacetylase family protein [Streptomyces sp. MK5]|uniref:polysaccharide deacetylase family protein n=1 Tax=Streptomyces sp. MK5 TaxID=3064253 RepID=UPI00274182A5|nr:polysaccharide deacetylase family protein [Streptomyces sp. MK5]